MASPILKITDGINIVDLLDKEGLLLRDWNPSIPQPKGGGVYRDSVMSDGRQLLMRRFSNPVETFNIVAQGGSQDSVIRATQELFRLLQKGTDYWENKWIDNPVWIEARGSLESEIRYALVHNYTVDNLSNPYTQPFFSCDPAIDGINVAIERGHWTSTAPTSPICVPIYSDDGSNTLEDTENVPGGTSDAYVRDALGAEDYTFWRTDTQLILGTESDTDEFEFAIRVDGVDIPQGCKVIYAAIGLRLASAHSSGNDQRVKIEIENNTDPAVYSDLTDYQSRPYASEYVIYDLDGGAGSAGDLYEIDGLHHIVQQIVDLGSWQAGNAMAFKFSVETHNAGDVWNFASYENASYAEPYLEVRYCPETRETDQCQSLGKLAWDVILKQNEAEIFFSARNSPVGLTHIFRYDASGTSYSSNLLTATLPYDLFPASPAAGDMIYFGSDQANLLGGAFFDLIFDPTDGFPDGNVGVWEYSKGGAAWQSLGSPPYYDDYTYGFEGSPAGSFGQHSAYDRLRGRSMRWQGLEDHSGSNSWREDTVNSVNAWWMRFRLTTYSSGNVTVQRHPCTVGSSKLSIDAGDVSGDFPALARLRFFGTGDLGGTMASRLIVGLRTRYPDRVAKPGFNAYLPIQDVFVPDGVIAITPHATKSAYEDHAASTNGRTLRYNPAASEDTEMLRVELDTQVFRGRYRLFFRCCAEGGSLTDTEIYARIISGNMYYDTRAVTRIPRSSSWITNMAITDLGVIDIPISSSALDETSSTIIALRANTTSGTPEVICESIILVPADEWIGEVEAYADTGGDDIGFRQDFISLDSLTDFREELLPLQGQQVTSTNRLETWRARKSAIGSFVVPPNTDLDFWIVPVGTQNSVEPNLYEGDVQYGYSARIEVLERYQGMRGNR
jgi:hypothetical protein